MVSFAYPYILYLLLLLPIIALVYWLAQVSRKNRLKKFGKIEVLTNLMPDYSKYKGWIKLSVQLLALAALILALARPRAGAKEEVTNVKGIEVMIALDVSNSMLASSNDDPKGISRLNRAKFILDRLIDKLNNDKIGLIVFAGESYTQLPITSDFVSAKMFLQSINTQMVPTQGTAIGSAISMAMNSFTPDKETQKAIIVITDGENHEDDAVAMAKTAQENGIQVNVIGLGSTKGTPIPLDASKGVFMKDSSGKPVTTYLNEKMAKEIADAGKGIYVNGGSSSAISEIDTQLDTLEKTDLERIVYTSSAEQFPVFAWIALLFLLIDVFILDGKNKFLKKYTFFSK